MFSSRLTRVSALSIKIFKILIGHNVTESCDRLPTVRQDVTTSDRMSLGQFDHDSASGWSLSVNTMEPFSDFVIYGWEPFSAFRSYKHSGAILPISDTQITEHPTDQESPRTTSANTPQSWPWNQTASYRPRSTH